MPDAPSHTTSRRRAVAVRVGVLAALVCTTPALATDPVSGTRSAPAVEAAQLAGQWSGPGRFLNVRFQASHGPVPITLRVQPDGTLTGQFGGATIPPCKPQAVRQHLHYQALLAGPIWPPGAVADPGKRHLVLLVTQADGQRLDANFHLKSRFGFDPSMQVGHLPAQRTP